VPHQVKKASHRPSPRLAEIRIQTFSGIRAEATV
jgi:hypothetical protein